MEDYVSFTIPEFNIKFKYPEWWDHKVEHSDTYLFWDEYVGSFRITPKVISKPDFNQEQFLQETFEEYAKYSPIWKTYNNRKFIYYEKFSKYNDNPVKNHFYITTEKNILLICSFGCDPILLEDEDSKDELECAIEDVDALLGGLTVE
jgi:hypothetical protein